MTIFVNGGAGSIGAYFVHDWIAAHDETAVNSDKLTYAGNLQTLVSLQGDARHVFEQGYIGDPAMDPRLLNADKPRAVVNIAAAHHVERYIHRRGYFNENNIAGTFSLLESVRGYWSVLPGSEKTAFRLLYVSTDKVYGTQGHDDLVFAKTNRYEPNSHYSACKAAPDHLVRTRLHTYGLPVLKSKSTNNYGPYHFSEKLIPRMTVNALVNKPLPVRGDDMQVRDWLYVKDHCSATRRVIEAGRLCEAYKVGGWNEKPNIEIVNTSCKLLDELRPKQEGSSYASQITYLCDRPGHDCRYAIDACKPKAELGCKPAEDFETGIRKTVDWYLSNTDWDTHLQGGAYREWGCKQYEV